MKIVFKHIVIIALIVSAGLALMLPAAATEPEGDALFQAFLDAVAHMEHDEALHGTRVGIDFFEVFTEGSPGLAFARRGERFVLAMGGTEEEWLNMSPFDRWVMWYSYLVVHDILARGQFSRFFDTYNAFRGSAHSPAHHSALHRINPEGWEALDALMYWQYNFILETGMPYNFFTRTAAPANLVDFGQNRQPEQPEIAFTDYELEEIEALIEETLEGTALEYEHYAPAAPSVEVVEDDESSSFPWAILIVIVIVAGGVAALIIWRHSLSTVFKVVIGVALGFVCGGGIMFLAFAGTEDVHAKDNAEVLLYQNCEAYYDDVEVGASYADIENLLEIDSEPSHRQYDDRDRLIQDALVDENGDVIGMVFFLYDENGNLVQITEANVVENSTTLTIYNDDGSFSRLVTVEGVGRGGSSFASQYNSQGTRESSVDAEYDMQGVELFRIETTYDYRGNASELFVRELFSDEAGAFQVSARFEIVDGEDILTQLNEYGANNILTQQTDFTAGVMSQTLVFDEFSNVVARKEFDEHENISRRTENEFSECGAKLLVVQEFDSGGVNTSRTELEYSENGSAVRRVVYELDGVGEVANRRVYHMADGQWTYDAPTPLAPAPTPSTPAQQAPRPAPRPMPSPAAQVQPPVVSPEPEPVLQQGCQDSRHGQGGIRATETQLDEFNRPTRETFQYFCGCRFDRVHERNAYGRIIRTTTVPH